MTTDNDGAAPNVLDFQATAISRLRARADALAQDNRVLAQLRRGQSSATAQVHAAVLAALDAGSLDHLIHIITQDWVDHLAVDAVALALATPGQGLRIAGQGLQFVSARAIASWLPHRGDVDIRSVATGSELFGPAAPLIRSEVLVRLRLPTPYPTAVLAIGSRVPLPEASAGQDSASVTELMGFLGAATGKLLVSWLSRAP